MRSFGLEADLDSHVPLKVSVDSRLHRACAHQVRHDLLLAAHLATQLSFFIHARARARTIGVDVMKRREYVMKRRIGQIQGLDGLAGTEGPMTSVTRNTIERMCVDTARSCTPTPCAQFVSEGNKLCDRKLIVSANKTCHAHCKLER